MRRLFIVSACLSIFVAAFAQDSPRYVNINGGPYLTNVTSTSFTVVYTTNMDAVSWVEIAPDDDTHFYNQERPAFYDKRGLGRRPITRTHKITVTGPKPGTTYRYRTMAKGVLEQDNRKSIVYTEGFGMDLNSHPCKVTTLGSDYKSVKFSVVNDMHSHDSVLCRLFADAAGKYDFVLFNGDMTSSIDTESQIMDDYLRSASRLFGECTPIHFVRGNHEYRGNAALKFYDYLDSPTGRTWYSFSYGDFFFLVLDGGEDKCQSDVRNLDIKGVWRKMPFDLRVILFNWPFGALAYLLDDAEYFVQSFFHNEGVPFWLLLYGSAGQIIFTLRFIYQWYYSYRRHHSILPIGFWIISLVGSGMIVSYAIFRHDAVLILGQSVGFITYSRNIMIGVGSKKTPES